MKLFLVLVTAIAIPLAACFQVYFNKPEPRLSLLMSALKERPRYTKEPLSLLESPRAISRIFDDSFFDPWAPLLPDHMSRMHLSSFTSDLRKISVGFEEHEKEYKLHADLPGVKKDDVKISVENGMLTISAERKDMKQHTRKNEKGEDETTGSETFSSTYYRSMMMPSDAEQDPEKIQAELVDGVLSIEIPKAVRAAPVPKLVKLR